MIDVKDLIKKELIKLEIKSKDKEGVIKELIELMKEKGYVTDSDVLFRDIMRREALESTGIGLGIAIPHARSAGVKEMCIAIGRSQEGVDFSSLDNKLSHLIFLIAFPSDKKAEYIMALAQLSRLLRDQKTWDLLYKATSEDEIVSIFKNSME